MLIFVRTISLHHLFGGHIAHLITTAYVSYHYIKSNSKLQNYYFPLKKVAAAAFNNP